MSDTLDVKAIHETRHQAEVNAYIDAGWKLLNTASGRWADTQEPFFKYTLGWDKETDPVKPKQNW